MKKISCFIFTIFSFAIFAQRINNFNAYLVDNSVGIKFTITKGTSCNGYSIKHSLDSVNFSEIYNYPGICGDTLIDVNVNYTHALPAANVINYYKIDLFPIETSSIKRIFVPEALTKPINIYPNPLYAISNLLTVRINNLKNTKLYGSIYSQKGSLLKVIELNSLNDTVLIGVSDLENGLYLLNLNDGQKTYSSKFIISR